jgi:hypothetical protein
VLVGVRWSETAEVGDRRLSKKDPRVGGTEKLDDEVSSLLLGGGGGACCLEINHAKGLWRVNGEREPRSATLCHGLACLSLQSILFVIIILRSDVAMDIN